MPGRLYPTAIFWRPGGWVHHMEAQSLQERQLLERGLTVLATLGHNAPFIGLFGTVMGIIKALHDLSANPAGGASLVMAGLSEALVATAVGIMVALPAAIAFNFFQRWVRTSLTSSAAVSKKLQACLLVAQEKP